MKFYILRPVGYPNEEGKLWTPWYDRNFGFIVSAPTAIEARQIAASEHGDEGPRAWLESQYSTCSELKQSKKAEIIMQDYAAG